jgi:hypothetical protein
MEIEEKEVNYKAAYKYYMTLITITTVMKLRFSFLQYVTSVVKRSQFNARYGYRFRRTGVSRILLL